MNDAPVAPATKPCRVCGEDIKASAQKCIRCDSYQDWRGRLGLSSTVLALLVALISVITNGVPIISAAFEAKIVPLKFVFQDVFSRAERANGAERLTQIASVWIYNAGTQPAFVSGLGLSINGAKGGNWYSGGVVLDSDKPATSPIEIAGKSGRTVRFDLGNHEAAISDSVKDKWKPPFRCELTYAYIDAAGQSKSDKGAIDCQKIWGVPWL